MKLKLKNPFLLKTIYFFKSYIELCLWLLAFAVGVRFFEVILLNQLSYNFTSNVVGNLTGLCYDISLYLSAGSWMLVAFVAVCFINEKAARITVRIILSLMLLLSLICVLFFANSGFLLDKVVFSYSIKDLLEIVQTSNQSPLGYYFIMITLPVAFFFISGLRIKINSKLLVVFIVLTISSFFIFKEIPLHSDQYLVKINKGHFFASSVFNKQNLPFKGNEEVLKSEEDILKAVEEFRSYFPDHPFAEVEYPFLYEAHYKDVLSPFFNLKTEPPNFVFIIVEGLGYEFLNNDYQLMPFLDSLSKKSLSWAHCLSVSARTFGVYPALFGAAPLGNQGLMYQCPNNPEYHSLLRILHQNNYTHHFFYGGSINFDNVRHFCDQNNMIYLKPDDWEQEVKDESTGIQSVYEDHIVYLQALRKLNKMHKTPRVDVYLSYYTHVPFKYPNSAHFQNRVKNKVVQNKTLSNKEKKEILGSLDIYGSFAYSDWALQQLMEGYQKREDFDNTIFIITGDHSVVSKQFGGHYNYHVPLIIYSPMLKTAKNMKGVVSHRDITPTILALLQHNFNIEIPKEAAWLNTELDTSSTFNASTFSPLQLIDHTIGGVLYKNYLLCEGILEELTHGVPRKINNPSILQQMNRLLYLYRSLDSYIFHNDALIKNDYSYKYRTANTIVDIDDPIEQESYFAQASNLQIKEAPEGRKTTLYFDGSYLYPINFLRLEIPKDIEELRVDIEFKIYIKNEGKEEFFVVSDLQEISYKSVCLDYDDQNRWYTYAHTLNYKKEIWEHLKEDCLLKIYLWNPHKLEGFVDDVKVKVRVLN